ncbi:hypothetical protein [Vibrio navarrensis]|uniref:hypothetical protein n=1 Tax=Vibrio navarrensis TaxID=29495 RepID=UPI0018DB8442|nr:hypothetical protein [Vibrio navarrensis]MBH9740050.1 hypothetical protein [Vibrio navarrensis]HDY8121393.1 hypothetical protein [Vibrio vulnificus]
MKDTITIKQAYVAMYLYLEGLYQMTGSDDLAGFLGGMSMLEDGQPADSAVWSDWLDAIEKSRRDPDISLEVDKTKT